MFCRRWRIWIEKDGNIYCGEARGFKPTAAKRNPLKRVEEGTAGRLLWLPV